MKKLITILAVTLSLFAFSATAQAQNVQQLEIANAPKKFYKSHLQRAIRNSGVNHAEYRKLKGVQVMINSLRFIDGQWRVKADSNLLNQLKELSEGKIKVKNGKLEFATADLGSDE